MLKKHFLQRIFVSIMAFLVVAGPVGSVYALDSKTEDYYAKIGVTFYDPQSNAGSCYSGGASLVGDSVMAKIVNYANGNNPSGIAMPAAGIAGLLAGLQGESGFNPFRWYADTYNPSKAYGLAQFYPSSKIAGPLSSDPRTASFFNEYFPTDAYTRYDGNTGYPTNPVPQEVIDAWLAVQLDYMFGPSGEYQRTRVGGYRNLGGRMGLDYIPDDYTLGQAMEAARTPEDATRIWVWIYERPEDKEAAANGRSRNAQGWLNFVNSIISSPAQIRDDATNNSSASSSNSGSNVTIIGDSLIANSQGKIAERMPQAQIDAQSGRSFADGISILQNIANGGQLRDYTVFAIGTDSTVTSAQAQQVVDIVGSSRKIIFVTNYSTSNSYTANNNVFTRMMNDNSNVRIADWKSSATSNSALVSSDGVTPTEEGQSMIATLIANNISVSGPAFGTCGDISAVEGGLNRSQAQAIADYYNSSEVRISDWNLSATGSTKRNCTSFSYFFVQRFTSIGHTSYSMFLPGGDGGDVAHNLSVNKALPSGDAPRPFSVFSVRGSSSEYGHTGIVVGVEGDNIITVEAAYSNNGPGRDGYVSTRPLSYFRNVTYGNPFTYLENIINLSDINSIVGGA